EPLPQGLELRLGVVRPGIRRRCPILELTDPTIASIELVLQPLDVVVGLAGAAELRLEARDALLGAALGRSSGSERLIVAAPERDAAQGQLDDRHVVEA